ncbi:MAG: ATP-binding protein [Bacteroidetes bacterium]|nr:ATP-binding protein [Bacteroidota bacterium]
MLVHLELTNVGPASQMEMDLGERLNLLTGDNGLGKTFLLDIAWWAVTRRWPAEVNRNLPAGLMARPNGDAEAAITFEFTGKSRSKNYTSEFDRRTQSWTGQAGRPTNPGLVLYAQVDGSFAVWDPARNYWRKKGDVDVQDRPPAYVFSPAEVWDGLRGEDGRQLCNGLIVDWAGWQKEKGEAFRRFKAVLRSLSPSDDEQIEPGLLTRISLDDSRDIPTLKMAYGQEVPVVHASAGMRRILALAYLLVWSWEEHVRASNLLGEPTTGQVIFLIDEIEAHLHPKWQRRIVKALLDVMKELAADATVQIVAATHSPLVLASVEPFFNSETDAWFDLDIVGSEREAPKVQLTRRPFVRHGDASGWLMSDAFDMRSARSLEAERVLDAATQAMQNPDFSRRQAQYVDRQLREVLSDVDPFWVRWRFVAEKKGWLAPMNQWPPPGREKRTAKGVGTEPQPDVKRRGRSRHEAEVVEVVAPAAKHRGRPRKEQEVSTGAAPAAKRRGRPRKEQGVSTVATPAAKRRGRPRKKGEPAKRTTRGRKTNSRRGGRQQGGMS